MGNLTRIVIELTFDDHPEPVAVHVGPDDVDTIPQTIDAIIYMEHHGTPKPLTPIGDLH